MQTVLFGNPHRTSDSHPPNRVRSCLVDIQVRLAVEKSLGLPEGSLHKGSKALIKEAVHSVMVRTGPTALVYEFHARRIRSF